MEILHHMDGLQFLFRPHWYAPRDSFFYLFPNISHDAVYFLYPETAGRTLEDIDRIFVGDTPLLIFCDKEAIAEKRPERFIQLEREEVRRHSSVVPAHVQLANDRYRNSVNEEEKNSGDYRKESV
jgi:hypothetical protein